MKKLHLIIDISKCEDCNNCFLSCKDEHVGNSWSGYSLSQPPHGQSWINILRKERGKYPIIDVAYLPVPCMHCDRAPCISAAREGAVYKREDGIVIIDPEKSRGQKGIVDACPYNAIWWNEEENVPQKCTFCAHLLDEGWEAPRCVQACPTGALRVVKMEDEEMAGLAKAQNLEHLHPEFRTAPRVYYENLYRYNRCFIGGSVAVVQDGMTDCAKGAIVTLYQQKQKIGKQTADTFGDFKFDNLEENSGSYSLKVHYGDYKSKRVDVNLTTSVNIGVIVFE